MTDTVAAPAGSEARTGYRTKLIEVALPLEAINAASAREKSIRHGHPSTLHLWWARRPLAACRAVLFAQLVDDPSAVPEEFPTEEAQEEERQRLFRIIEELVKWENSTNEAVLTAARREIARSVARTAGVPGPETDADIWRILREHAPPVLDPFCGGGSIPLEAQRLGLEAHASDLNPVAVLITKALIEIPPKFAGMPPVNPRDRDRGMGAAWKGAAGLAADVRYYGEWMREEAFKRIGHLYPKATLPDGSEATVIAWLWARTVTCPNPACGAQMPLVRSFALSTKKGKETWVEPVVDHEAKTVRFEVRSGKGKVPEPPKLGRGAKFRCLVCGNIADDQHIKDEGLAGHMSQQLMAVVAEGPRGRIYLAPTERQWQAAQVAPPNGVPTQPLADDPRNIWCVGYGLGTFDKLFTARQLVALTTFSDLVGEARERVLADYPHPPTPSPSRGEGERDGGAVGVAGGEDGGPPVRLAISRDLEARMVEVARGFRKEPTASEQRLWGLLRGRQLGPRFRRQQPIGPFVVDFFCPEHRLIVEVDGQIHDQQADRDRERQHLLEACGYRVLRISAAEVEHTPTTALGHIRAALNSTSSPPSSPIPPAIEAPLSPRGRGVGGEGDDGMPLEQGGRGATAYADAVATYLALGVDKLTDYNSTLVSWSQSRDQAAHVFTRQALPMVWDFCEVSPFAGAAGDISTSLNGIVGGVRSLPALMRAEARQQNAARLSGSDGRVICTDPPYYDNIGYGDLSDYFYVWLRRSLRVAYPDILSTLLVPKGEEIVASPYRFHGDKDEADKHFEGGLRAAFYAAYEVEVPGFPAAIFYAFKQSEEMEGNSGEDGAIASTGWETMLAALLRTGFSITGTWPMRTERGARTLSIGTNALASSIVLVCRPRPESASIATRRQFISALRSELPAALKHLTHGNIAPVDLAQAAIGPGMRVFSRYAKVIESDGTPMTVRTALGLINQVLYEVEAESESEYDPDTRWAVTWFEQFGMAEGPYGDAETLSKAKDTSVGGLQEAGIVHARGGKVRLRRREELDAGWDPATDRRLTVWEVTQHLIRALDESEGTAAGLLRRVGGLGDAARDLAYALYLVADRKKWAEEAMAYNGLVVAWPEISKLAAASEPGQAGLGLE